MFVLSISLLILELIWLKFMWNNKWLSDYFFIQMYKQNITVKYMLKENRNKRK